MLRASFLGFLFGSVALAGCDDATPGTGGSGSTSASKGSSSATTTSQSNASSATGASGSSSSGGGMGRSIAITNHGFEADIVANGTYNDKITPQGWTLIDPPPMPIIGLDYNSRGVLNPTNTTLYAAGAPEGKNVALIFLWRAETNDIPVGLSQETAEVIAPFTQYTLRVRVGNINGEPGFPYELDGFPGYRVELRAGGAVLASDVALSPADGTFEESVIVHSIGASDPAIGQKLGVAMFNLNKGNSGIEVNFDDVRIDAVEID